MAPPIVPIQSIPDEGLSLEIPLDDAWLRGILEDTEVTPAPAVTAGKRGQARLRLDRDGLNVILSGSFDAVVAATCVACLEPVALPLHGEFQLLLEPRNAAPAPGAHGAHGARGETELTADELDVDYYDDDKVDVGQWLREQVLLEAPLHPRHEGDCPVVLAPPAPPAAEIRSIDPRLAPLQKLKKE